MFFGLQQVDLTRQPVKLGDGDLLAIVDARTDADGAVSGGVNQGGAALP